MIIAYFDCFSGASGDMIVGSLIDAGADVDALRDELAKLGLHGYDIAAAKTTRGALAGTKFDVVVDHHEHHHRGLSDIVAMIEASGLSPSVKQKSTAIFQRLAEAEAGVHGTSVEEVHFHEVGAVDSIIDIVGAVIALELLKVDNVRCSPMRFGTGTVKAAHGELPVPVPATVALTLGFPAVGTTVVGELTTPTGAAILTTLSTGYGPQPAMMPSAIGYGAGSRQRQGLPNLLRVVVGDAVIDYEFDEVVMVETNLDDISGETIGYVTEKLLAEGALDVFTIPIQMKKNRPAVLLQALVEPADAQRVQDTILRETTTFGVRCYPVQRTKLSRRFDEVDTPYGRVRIKVGLMGGEVRKAAPEYEDCRRLAEKSGVELRTVRDAAIRAWQDGRQAAS